MEILTSLLLSIVANVVAYCRDYRDDDARLAANKWGSPMPMVNTYKDEKDMSFDELITFYGVQRQYYQWSNDEQRKARSINGLCVSEVG